MTHYLRRNGKSIVDVEAGRTDLRCVVCIDEYSVLLLSETSRQAELIIDFGGLQEMRGEWHEDPEQFESPDEFVQRRLCEVGNKYGLQYVTD